MFLLLLACVIDQAGPATPGSISAEEAAAVSAISAQATEIDRLAGELTSLVDESRRQVADGRSTQAAEIEKMRELMDRIAEKNTALQADMSALENRVHERASDPAWPPEPVNKR